MEDALYYKVRSISHDLTYLLEEVDRVGFRDLFPTESKRRAVRTMLTEVVKNVQSIQSKMPEELRSEFQDAPVL
jgi:hypothetical protein